MLASDTVRIMADEQETQKPPAEPVRDANWTLRILLVLLLLASVATAYIVGTTLVPRWWAHRVGNRIDGSITAGTLYGLFLGFVFTFVPLVLARQLFRKVGNAVRIALLLVALVVAAPNLMTLSIVVGNGSGAHAGDRILDVDGPGFRVGTAWGAAIAVVLAVGVFAWTWKWRRDRRQLKSLKAERKAATSTAKES